MNEELVLMSCLSSGVLEKVNSLRMVKGRRRRIYWGRPESRMVTVPRGYDWTVIYMGTLIWSPGFKVYGLC